MLTIRCERS